MRARLVLVSLAAVLVMAALPPTLARSASAVNVRAYGALGNGRSDDTAAFRSAIEAARRTDRAVFVPVGRYKVSDLRLPDGITITGAGKRTWLQGKLTFGSNDVVRDMMIGRRGVSAVHNRAGATSTRFERCRFRGGAGRAYTYVVDLGSGNACSRITFMDCDVERNLGVEAGGSGGFNDICIWVAGNAPVSNITFDGCHIGVSNGQGGHDTGAPRMGIECYVDSTPMARSFSNITLRDCVVEAADMETADFSDYSRARAKNVLIEGCTFKGGGYANTALKYVLNFEMPLGVVVRNNVFQRGLGGWGYVLNFTDRGDSAFSGPGAIITGNIFDLDTDNGIAVVDGSPIVLTGYDSQFTNNTVKCHYGTQAILVLDDAFRTTVAGNTFNTGNRPPLRTTSTSLGNTVSL